MPYLRRQEVRPRPLNVPHCGLGLLGDLVCPHCRAVIVTPGGFDVVAGWGRCPACHQRFKVLKVTAEAANRRTAGCEQRRLGV